ncbi:MAG: hypothetical protein ACRENE_13310 [Polyangiaceae bacterium]
MAKASLSFLARRWTCAALIGASMTTSVLARAQSAARDAVVVDVSPPGSLDAYRLRAAIGVELGVDAVAADDPRAAAARGVVLVVVDAEGHHLTVTYRKKTEPETRTVDLPADPEAAQRAAVVLAGNLGRDEASELAAQLRKAPAPAVKPAETAPAFVDVAPPDEAEQREAEKNAHDLQAALDYAARQDHRLRVAAGWTTVAGAAVALGAILATPAVNNQSYANIGTYWAATGLVNIPVAAMALFGGFIPLLAPTPLERLADSSRQGIGPQETAERWIRSAALEHSARRVGGWFLLAGGCLELAVGIATAMAQDPHIDSGVRVQLAAEGIGAGVLFTGMGVVFLANDGPTETALHAYERAHGIPLWKLAEHVAVAPTSGGAVGSLSFRF